MQYDHEGRKDYLTYNVNVRQVFLKELRSANLKGSIILKIADYTTERDYMEDKHQELLQRRYILSKSSSGYSKKKSGSENSKKDSSSGV